METNQRPFRNYVSNLEENDERQYSIEELMSIMGRIESKDFSYSKKHLKRKLKEHFGDSIVVTDIPGKNGVVCFSHCMKNILNDSWYTNRKCNTADEAKRIIETAALIIRSDTCT